MKITAESDFIIEQLELYKACLQNSEILNFDMFVTCDGIMVPLEDTIANFRGENIVEEVESEIRYSRQINDIDYDKAKKVTISFKRILEFLEAKKSSGVSKAIFDNYKEKKLTEKWYALAYWIELNAKGLHAPRTPEGELIKKEIEEIGKQRTGRLGQGFYKEFREIISTDKEMLKMKFGPKWADTIRSIISDEKVIEYLDEVYSI